ncbi:hypothetical protein SAMN05216490_0142 [Mucilaginibacter mallensis]|uniref:Uncharacterized protein n=1 Tax=Mucilaginibacter mallensis TaxID=652787 RepID=A0A1H1MRI5_MUCMA|nr:hypothetical protein [Mucilaginibacter mallensis]SDR89222.1 hypothetical protein SAMN05216490_0142 [Mucilaginibacter mallensis]
MLDQINTYKLDWDPITVDGYNENNNVVTMVFNCNITTESKYQEVVKYVVGRTLWCSYNLPSKAIITLSFDIRGQGVIMTKSNMFKLELLEKINVFQIDNQIIIDFLR